MSRIPKAVVQAVYERCGGQCELNDADLPVGADLPRRMSGRMVFHHRQARAMGGSKRPQDTVENLRYLHSECHEFIHAHPVWARQHGYIVSQYAETP